MCHLETEATTISHHQQQSDNYFAAAHRQDIYVDNTVTGVGTLEEAKALYSEANSLFPAASIYLREQSSNSEQSMESVPQPSLAAIVELKVLSTNATYSMTSYLYLLLTPLTRLRTPPQGEGYIT